MAGKVVELYPAEARRMFRCLGKVEEQIADHHPHKRAWVHGERDGSVRSVSTEAEVKEEESGEEIHVHRVRVWGFNCLMSRKFVCLFVPF